MLLVLRLELVPVLDLAIRGQKNAATPLLLLLLLLQRQVMPPDGASCVRVARPRSRRHRIPSHGHNNTLTVVAVVAYRRPAKKMALHIPRVTPPLAFYNALPPPFPSVGSTLRAP